MVILDASKMVSRQEAHRYLKEQLAFPDYYGKSLPILQWFSWICAAPKAPISTRCCRSFGKPPRTTRA